METSVMKEKDLMGMLDHVPAGVFLRPPVIGGSLIDEVLNRILAFAGAVLFPVSALLFGHSHRVMVIILSGVGTAGTVSLSVLSSTSVATTIAFSIAGKTNPHTQSHRYQENHNTRHYSFHLLLLVFVIPFKIF